MKNTLYFALLICSFNSFAGCESLDDYSNGTNPREACFAIKAGMQKNCSGQEKYAHGISPLSICRSVKIAISGGDCSDLDNYGHGISPKEFCVGVKSAYVAGKCDGLKEQSLGISQKQVCLSALAQLSGSSTIVKTLSPDAYLISPLELYKSFKQAGFKK